jgi:hypothetical protein
MVERLALALAVATAPVVTIRSVSTYFENAPDSGWDVIFAGRIGTDYHRLRAGARTRHLRSED